MDRFCSLFLTDSMHYSSWNYILRGNRDELRHKIAVVSHHSLSFISLGLTHHTFCLSLSQPLFDVEALRDTLINDCEETKYHKVKYDRPGECSPEKDCLRWHWLTFRQPERKSSSESSDLCNVGRYYKNSGREREKETKVEPAEETKSPITNLITDIFLKSGESVIIANIYNLVGL